MENENSRNEKIETNFENLKLENFLNKVKSKLNSGIEDIGHSNENIVSQWLDDIKNNKSDKLVFNSKLYEQNINSHQRNEIDNFFNPTDKNEEFEKPNNNSSQFLSTMKQLLNSNETVPNNFSNLLSEFKSSNFNLQESEEIESILFDLVDKAENKYPNWEILKAIVNIFTITIKEDKPCFNPNQIIKCIDSNFEKLINHSEYRFRTELIDLIGEIVNKEESALYVKNMFDVVFADIIRNFKFEQNAPSNITLETSKSILLVILNKTKFDNLLTSEMITNIINYLDNSNKGVRLSSSEILEHFIHFLQKHNSFPDDILETLRISNSRILFKLSPNLIDFYAQVRFSSINLLKRIYNFNKEVFKIDLTMDEYFNNNILPKICLNRYLPVDGVKNISLALWKELVGLHGVKILKQQFEIYLNQYLQEMTSKFYSAKEAACRCLQEILIKVYDYNEHNIIISNNANLMFKLTINCIKDPSWSVREASLNSAGNTASLIFKFLKKEEIQSFIGILKLHLFDNVIEVRDAAAFSLRTLLMNLDEADFKLINEEFFDFAYFVNVLMDEVGSSSSLNQSYIILKNKIFDKIKENTNNPNVIPDLGFMRELELWEYTDGIFHLLKEISEEDSLIIKLKLDINKIVQIVIDYLTRNYNTSDNLLKKTIWSLLSVLFCKIKKSEIEFIFEGLIDILYRELKNSSTLSSCEAEKLILQLSKLISKKFIVNKFKSLKDKNMDTRIQELLNDK